ncbi:MAG: transposase family protein [Sulfurimonas sp.]|nr:transposase family protein [Sulfurimonas sp.]
MKDQKAKKYYSGKKKKHTQKAQIITNIKGKILAVTIAKGKMHDFRLFKNSNPTKKILMSRVLADLGYLGIDKICPNATIPNKKQKENLLQKKRKKRIINYHLIVS